MTRRRENDNGSKKGREVEEGSGGRRRKFGDDKDAAGSQVWGLRLCDAARPGGIIFIYFHFHLSSSAFAAAEKFQVLRGVRSASDPKL